MISRKPKIDHLLDQIFAFYIKCRDGWACQAPGCSALLFDVGDEYLDCSHFHRCSHQGTRHHEDNCDAFCRSCHVKWEKLKKGGQEYHIWKLEQLGSDKFEELHLLKNSIVKLNDRDRTDLAAEFLKKIYKLGYETKDFRKKVLAFNQN